MCVLKDSVGDVSRPLVRGRGGGVRDRARGLLWLDGEGDMAGDDASCTDHRFGAGTCVSSSDGVLGSSSLSSDDTSGGTFSTRLSPFLEESPFAGLTADGPGAAGDAAAVEASPWLGSRRVRGRLSFLSGSGTGSDGDAVTDRFRRLRDAPLPLRESASRARSKAPHARLSSLVSSTGGGGG